MSEQPPEVARPIRVDELSEHLGITVESIRTRIRCGDIRATKLGRAWLIPASELARLSGVEVAA